MLNPPRLNIRPCCNIYRLTSSTCSTLRPTSYFTTWNWNLWNSNLMEFLSINSVWSNCTFTIWCTPNSNSMMFVTITDKSSITTSFRGLIWCSFQKTARINLNKNNWTNFTDLTLKWPLLACTCTMVTNS